MASKNSKTSGSCRLLLNISKKKKKKKSDQHVALSNQSQLILCIEKLKTKT